MYIYIYIYGSIYIYIFPGSCIKVSRRSLGFLEGYYKGSFKCSVEEAQEFEEFCRAWAFVCFRV